jgi:ribosomal protein L31E
MVASLDATVELADAGAAAAKARGSKTVKYLIKNMVQRVFVSDEGGIVIDPRIDKRVWSGVKGRRAWPKLECRAMIKGQTGQTNRNLQQDIYLKHTKRLEAV